MYKMYAEKQEMEIHHYLKIFLMDLTKSKDDDDEDKNDGFRNEKFANYDNKPLK